MGRIRAFLEDDIPDIVALRQKTFKHSDRATSSELAAYMREMFLSAPWRDETMPSLVYEDASGRPSGFVGVFPRRMLFDGEPILVAVFTQLMVDTACRGIAGLALLRHLFRGPQDLSLADAANEAARGIAKGTGARVALLSSLSWTRPLRPWRYALAGVGANRVQRAVRLAARPLVALGDATATRMRHSTFAQIKPTTSTTAPAVPRPLPTRAIVEHWPSMTRSYRLAGNADEPTLEFVLTNAARKSSFGTLEKVLVQEASGTPVGWYIYYSKKNDVGEVVDVAAAPGKYADVLDHLFYHAWERGAIAVRGRLTPHELPLLTQKHCVLEGRGPWTVVHSRRRDILESIERGEARLSRLDGEFWMTF
jgi:hypothetical protein